jgi:hypothetical protein
MTEDPVITIADIRATGHCVAGARRWFEAHELDFADFVANGLPASTLLATDDALAEQVVGATLERLSGGPTNG